MVPKLDPAQRRVLGVLIEKARTTPAGYPLTLASLVAGCNQLSCREPVMKLTDDDAARAARQLKERRLVAEVEGARVERYRHLVPETLGWDDTRQSVMAELLLRGPQTAGELRTNAARMAPMPELEALTKLLEEWSGGETALVRELPRQPGKSVRRYDHLLYDQEPAAATPAASASLEARVAKLEADIAALQEELRKLRP